MISFNTRVRPLLCSALLAVGNIGVDLREQFIFRLKISILVLSL